MRTGPMHLASSHRLMTHGFDPVSVGVPEERRIIRPVIIPEAGRAVIAAAGGYACIPERIALRPPLRLEAPMPAECLVGLVALADRDVDAIRISRPRPLAISQPVFA